MDYELGGVGMSVAVSPRRMSLTLTSSPRGKSAHAHADHAGGGASAELGGSPNTVLYHAFEGVAAGASPRTASDDGTEASPVDAAAGLQRHLTRAQALVRPSRRRRPHPGVAGRLGAPPTALQRRGAA